MKDVHHPNWIPADAPEAAVAIGGGASVVTDADVGGITAAAPAPANPWANPVSAFNRVATAPTVGETHKHATRADEAIAFLRRSGPSAPGELCKALGITSKGGVTPFINGALKDGRIVRIDGKYALPGESPAEKSCEPETSTASAAPTPARAAAAIAAMRQPQAEAVPTPAPAAISHFEAATSIVAKRKQSASKPKNVETFPAEPPRPSPPPMPKPEFVIFVDHLQLLCWPDGAITIQTESSMVELKPQHFRALMTLVELRK